MKRSILPVCSCSVPLALALTAGMSRAQCPTFNFENLAVGTAVTTQYAGVTFSVVPQSCGNNPTLFMRTTTAAAGTSSGTKCLKIDQGCPSFSDDYLRMVFDNLQSEVTFVLGDWATTYTVRAYSTFSGAGGLISSTPVVLPGAGQLAVYRFVRVTAPLGDMRRIEVQGATSTFEAIDDLTLVDNTPPTAQIASPLFGTCGCTTVLVTGVACDSDGVYGNDRLEYRRVGVPLFVGWTQVGTFTSPLCTSGQLYSWNTTGLTEGYYYLRLTATNACGLSATDQTVVYVDKSFTLTEADVRAPANGAILGGSVCIDGTVWDQCFTSRTVRYRPTAGGAFAPVDPANPSYPAPVVNDPLAVWNTVAGAAAVADGSYQIEVAGTDMCGASAAVLRTVTIDNTPPAAAISSPVECSYRCGIVAVSGVVSDAHLAGWALAYTGGHGHGWITIASGNAPINGLLGNWDTTGLVPCDYTLRLQVSDTANISCSGNANSREYLVSLHVGAYANCDSSTIVPVLNVNDFACFLNAFAAGCP